MIAETETTQRGTFVGRALVLISFQLRTNLASVATMLVFVFTPLLFAAIVGFLYEAYAPTENVSRAMGGSVVAGIWNSSLYLSALMVGNERGWGTLEAHLGMNTSTTNAMLTKCLANALQGLIGGFVALGLVHVITGSPIALDQPLALAISLVVAIFAIGSLATAVAPLFILYRTPVGVLSLFDTGLLLLSATFFSPEVYPPAVRWISLFSPLRWSSDALEVSGDGKSSSVPYLEWAVLVLLMAFFVACAILLFRLVEHRARVTGTLAV